jgi:anti-anti-sigma factor
MIFEVSNPAPGTFELRGELDISTAPLLSDAVIPTIGEGDVFFDLTNLSFMDASGLRAVVEVAEQLAEGSLVVAAPQPIVEKVLELTGVMERRNIRLLEQAAILRRSAG